MRGLVHLRVRQSRSERVFVLLASLGCASLVSALIIVAVVLLLSAPSLWAWIAACLGVLGFIILEIGWERREHARGQVQRAQQRHMDRGEIS